MKKAEQCVSSGLFKDVELTEGRGEINKPHFYQSVVSSLTKCLPESDLVQRLKALDKRYWPREQEAVTLYKKNKKYGKLQGTPQDKTLERLCIASHTYLSTSPAVNDTISQPVA